MFLPSPIGSEAPVDASDSSEAVEGTRRATAVTSVFEDAGTREFAFGPAEWSDCAIRRSWLVSRIAFEVLDLEAAVSDPCFPLCVKRGKYFLNIPALFTTNVWFTNIVDYKYPGGGLLRCCRKDGFREIEAIEGRDQPHVTPKWGRLGRMVG